MSTRDAVAAEDITGMGRLTNLKGRYPKTNPIQLYALPKVKHTDESKTKIWAIIKSKHSPWGAGATVIYSAVAPGYKYVWSIDEEIFTVTDDLGGVTTYYNMRSIRDLPVNWGVFKSPQLTIHSNNYSDNDTELVAQRIPNKKDSYTHKYAPTSNHYLDDCDQHAIFNVLSFMQDFLADSGLVNVGDITACLEDRTILLAYTGGELNAVGDFPLQIIGVESICYADRQAVDRPGMYLDKVHFLLIALFSNNLLTKDSHIVIEPWMLWLAFQWYTKPANNRADSRQIFDISPRW